MAEEGEKKKAGLVKLILKWIGLVVVSVLLIGAIIFQAPWKVATLLVIIFAACTILPKPYRKWFWLSVAGVVVALIVWVFLPEDIEGWRRYTFDEELAVMEAKYAVADEENAATIYNKLLESYDVNDFEPNFADVDFWDLVHSGPWRSEDYPDAAAWLKGHQSTIDTLIEAAKKEKCHFQINADLISFDSTMDRLSPMRRWAYLLIYAGNNDLAEGRINSGLEKYIAVLQMGKHQCQQPATIDVIVGIAIEALALRQFNRFIITSNLTEAHIDIIEEALAETKHDWSHYLPKFLEHEKLFAKNIWGMCYYGINPEGKVKLNPHSIVTMAKTQCPEEPLPFTYWHIKLFKAHTILNWLYVPSTPQKLGKIIDKCYEKYYAMAGPDYDWQKELEKPSSMFRLNYSYLFEYTTGILGAGWHRIHDIYLRLNADKRGSRIIIALRRYKNKEGRWPGSLDEIESLVPAEILVDPINNGTFVYKLTEENFTLYSKGKNNIDEDGERDEDAGKDDWLIWPRGRGCKSEEEDEDEDDE